jgi:hypothetical protein
MLEETVKADLPKIMAGPIELNPNLVEKKVILTYPLRKKGLLKSMGGKCIDYLNLFYEIAGW